MMMTMQKLNGTEACQTHVIEQRHMHVTLDIGTAVWTVHFFFDS